MWVDETVRVLLLFYIGRNYVYANMLCKGVFCTADLVSYYNFRSSVKHINTELLSSIITKGVEVSLVGALCVCMEIKR